MAKKLNEQQQKFVDNFVIHGNSTKAAEQAGYAHPKQRGCELRKRYAHNIMEQTKETMADMMPDLLRTVASIAMEEPSATLRLKACQDLMDRAGYKPVERTESEVYSMDVRTTEEMEAELAEMLGNSDTLRLVQ